MDRLIQSSERLEKTIGKRKGRYFIELEGTGTTFNNRYSPALDLTGNYEIAMMSLDTYYSTPNISSTNNSLKVYNGTTWSTISLPEGSYEITDISDAIGLSQVTLSANTATLKSVITIVAPYKVDFNVPNSIASVLGFESRIYDGGVSQSTNTVNIMSVTNFKVVTNIVCGSYNNNNVGNTLYSFFPDASPGEKIIVTPPMPIYLPVSVDKLSELYVALVDQNNTPINLRGERLTIRLYIREF